MRCKLREGNSRSNLIEREKVRSPRWVFLLVATMLLAVRSAEAQLSGSGIPGFFGIKSGSQAPPGAYVSYIFLDYAQPRLSDRMAANSPSSRARLVSMGTPPG